MKKRVTKKVAPNLLCVGKSSNKKMGYKAPGDAQYRSILWAQRIWERRTTQ